MHNTLIASPASVPGLMKVKRDIRPSSVSTTCSIGHGSNTQTKREKRVRGTSLLGVLEGTVPPHSTRSLLAFGPLLVTLAHHKQGEMKKLQNK